MGTLVISVMGGFNASVFTEALGWRRLLRSQEEMIKSAINKKKWPIRIWDIIFISFGIYKKKIIVLEIQLKRCPFHVCKVVILN